jgi:hypothetical protein
MASKSGLSSDPTRNAVHRPDDRFVPLRPAELRDALAADASRFGITASQIAAVAAVLDEVLSQEALAFARWIDNLYAPVNPDRDTNPPPTAVRQPAPDRYRQLSAALRYLLSKANYVELSAVEIERAIRMANTHGVSVRLRPGLIAELALWVRGRGTVRRNIRRWRDILHWRTWRELARGRPTDVPVYRRLAVVGRLRDDPHVLVKLFKEIPESDVEALLPHAEVSMNIFDRLLVFGSGAGALGSAIWKAILFLTGSVVALSQLLWVVFIGTLMMLYRTLLGYRRTRKRRDSQRTSNLYFQNLANNAAAIQVLVAMIAQEDYKEALLAYVFSAAAHVPADEASLDRRVEAYLRERFGTALDFDSRDALNTLDRLGLTLCNSPGRVLPPDRATAQLRALHESRATIEHHIRQANGQ